MRYNPQPRSGGSSAPMRRLPQEDHADLGLVDDDRTEDMRKPPASSSVSHHRAAEGSLNIHHPGGPPMTVQPEGTER